MSKRHDRQEQIYQFICDYYEENGFSPTVREISRGVGLKGISSVCGHLDSLEADGRITMKHGMARTIVPIKAM